jgi:hypothetical protein
LRNCGILQLKKMWPFWGRLSARWLAGGIGPLGNKQECFSEVYTGNPSIILYSMFFLTDYLKTDRIIAQLVHDAIYMIRE